MRMLQSMGELRIGFARSMGLLEVHGVDRIESVIQHTKTLKRHNPAGYAIQALTDDRAILSASQQDDYSRGDGLAYITGKYATFSEH